jgi:hypothetical protein
LFFFSLVNGLRVRLLDLMFAIRLTERTRVAVMQVTAELVRKLRHRRGLFRPRLRIEEWGEDFLRLADPLPAAFCALTVLHALETPKIGGRSWPVRVDGYPAGLQTSGQETVVLKVSDYLKHAEECEALARSADVPEHVEALKRMAQTWRELAQAREAEVLRAKRVANIDKKRSED